MKRYFLLKNLILLIVLATLTFSCNTKEKNDSFLILTTTDVTAITQSTATSGGNITDDGGTAITERGICWNTSSTPTIAYSKTSDGAGTGIFSSQISGLTENTKYYVRAYATNSAGTVYGFEKTFTTRSLLPILTTAYVTAITQSTATCGGNITDDGGTTITERGICWNTSSTPTIANSKTSDGSGTGTFTSQITGLTGNTKYCVRAYATNSTGTAYGVEKTFTSASLTGTWDKTFYIDSDENRGSMILVQHDDGLLTGSFVFSDGSGYTQLLSSSKITNNSVTIEWWLGSKYLCSFRGTVNSDYNYMSGNWYANTKFISTWSATKSSIKSAVTNNNPTNSEIERFIKMLSDFTFKD
jgi:hypothetical protein